MLSPSVIRSRPITPEDLDAIARLLIQGYPNRSIQFFKAAFARLAEHRTPSDFPKFGYVLESDGSAVGAILLIFSSIVDNGKVCIRANGAFWYVDPRYRVFAGVFLAQACGRRDVTYLNLTPGRHTWGILDAQRYKRFINGEFMALAALKVSSLGASVRRAGATETDIIGLSAFEVDLIRDHEQFGCLSLVCRSGGNAYPFVFERRVRSGVLKLRYARLVYCRDLTEFVRFAGPIGRFLAVRGMVLVCIDANGPIQGLLGKYSKANTPKYFKGPCVPNLGNFAYTERVMFENG